MYLKLYLIICYLKNAILRPLEVFTQLYFTLPRNFVFLFKNYFLVCLNKE